MYNGLMNLMNNLEARYQISIIDNTIMHTENKYNVLLAIDPISISMAGLAIAAGGVLNFETEQVTTILVDNNYLNMTEEGKRFIIAHEVGHITYQIEKFRSGNYVRNIEDEFEADEYAMEQVGLEASLQGLNEIKAILIDSFVAQECIDEIDTRMENLINKSMVTC